MSKKRRKPDNNGVHRDRQEMQQFEEQRFRVRGIFERYGRKSGWKGREERTLLLRSVVKVNDETALCDHLWFNLTKGFAALGNLAEGDIIELDARVKMYWKGYFGRRDDIDLMLDKPPTISYKLSHPTKIRKVERDHAAQRR